MNDIGGRVSPNDFAKKQKYEQKSSSLLRFLEREKVRLEKLQWLFEEKLPEKGQFSERESLYERQSEHLFQMRKKLVQIMADENSPFQHHLRKFFRQTF